MQHAWKWCVEFENGQLDMFHGRNRTSQPSTSTTYVTAAGVEEVDESQFGIIYRMPQ
jgi:hypothetical protein